MEITRTADIGQHFNVVWMPAPRMREFAGSMISILQSYLAAPPTESYEGYQVLEIHGRYAEDGDGDEQETDPETLGGQRTYAGDVWDLPATVQRLLDTSEGPTQAILIVRGKKLPGQMPTGPIEVS